MKSKLIVSLAILSSLVTTLSATVFPGVARAGEGGIAAAASFTMDGSGNVLSVSVASSIGKSLATAAAFIYKPSATSILQSKAWAYGSGSSQFEVQNLGSETFNISDTSEDASHMGIIQANTFSNNTVNILTPGDAGSSVVKSPSSL
jgi:hypothetical protein